MLLNFLSIGSDGAYYFPVQVLHKLLFGRLTAVVFVSILSIKAA